MRVNVDFDVDLDVDFEVGLSHTRMRRLIHTMLTPDLDSRSPILMTWRDRAACLGEDPELFFPIGSTGPELVQIEEAKAVCRRCEVVDSCMKWAVESGQEAADLIDGQDVWPVSAPLSPPPVGLCTTQDRRWSWLETCCIFTWSTYLVINGGPAGPPP